MKVFYTYLIATAIFFALDMVWLGFIARNLYKEKLGFILSGNINWPAAIIFYLLYIGGIVYFAIYPAQQGSNWQLALLNGALLGFVCYATYDLTNLATIDKWPVSIVVIDLIWGTVLTGSVAVASYFASRIFI